MYGITKTNSITLIYTELKDFQKVSDKVLDVLIIWVFEKTQQFLRFSL